VEDLRGILTALVLLAIAIAVWLYVPAFLTRRAMLEVVRRFYRLNAVRPDQAKTIDELGLASPTLLQRVSRPRDYKPHALRLLQQIGAVQVTEDLKLYLVEENLHDNLKREKVM
jgi:hypothetical protein